MVEPVEFSVVIPSFNEAASLPLLQQRLKKVMEETKERYEILYVDDGSSDDTLAVLQALKKDSPCLRSISLKKKRGQSVALYAGFSAARGKWIITLDADGQNPPEEIPKLLSFRDRFDCVCGVRRARKDSALRKFDSHIARVVRSWVLGDTTQDVGCSLRTFRREIVDALPRVRNFHRFFTFLVRQMGFSVKEVSVAHDKRLFGNSKYGTWARLREGWRDLWGMRWLKSRIITYEVTHED